MLYVVIFFSYMWFLLDLSFGRTCLRITSAKFVQVVLYTASIVTISEQMLWCGFFHVFVNMGWLFYCSVYAVYLTMYDALVVVPFKELLDLALSIWIVLI